MAVITNPLITPMAMEYKHVAEQMRNLAMRCAALKADYWATGGISDIIASAADGDTISGMVATKAQLVAMEAAVEAIDAVLNTQAHASSARQFIFAMGTPSA